MNNFFYVSTTYSAAAAEIRPLILPPSPLTFVGAYLYVSAFGGSPTAKNLSISVVDSAEEADSITLLPSTAITTAVNWLTPSEPVAVPVNSYRYFCRATHTFTGGSSPTLSGTLLLKFAY